jgi:hypothetical protein
LIETVYGIQSRPCFFPRYRWFTVREGSLYGSSILGVFDGFQFRQIVNQLHNPPCPFLGKASQFRKCLVDRNHAGSIPGIELRVNRGLPTRRLPIAVGDLPIDAASGARRPFYAPFPQGLLNSRLPIREPYGVPKTSYLAFARGHISCEFSSRLPRE